MDNGRPEVELVDPADTLKIRAFGMLKIKDVHIA